MLKQVGKAYFGMNKRIQKAKLPDYFHIFIIDFKISLYRYAVIDSGGDSDVWMGHRSTGLFFKIK